MTMSDSTDARPLEGVDPTIRAFGVVGGARLRGVVTVVVPCLCIDDFFPTGDKSEKLKLWIQTVVLTHLDRKATFRLVYE